MQSLYGEDEKCMCIYVSLSSQVPHRFRIGLHYSSQLSQSWHYDPRRPHADNSHLRALKAAHCTTLPLPHPSLSDPAPGSHHHHHLPQSSAGMPHVTDTQFYQKSREFWPLFYLNKGIFFFFFSGEKFTSTCRVCALACPHLWQIRQTDLHKRLVLAYIILEPYWFLIKVNVEVKYPTIQILKSTKNVHLKIHNTINNVTVCNYIYMLVFNQHVNMSLLKPHDTICYSIV